LAIPGFVLGYFVFYNQYEIPGFGFNQRKQGNLFQKSFENYTNELALMLVILGLVFIAFSKIKKEDELTARIRLNALYWAVLVNFMAYAVFICLALANTVIHTSAVEWVMDEFSNGLQFTVYNFFAPLLIFILRFYYLLYKNKREYEMKEVRLLPNRPFNIIGKVLSIIIIPLVIYNSIQSTKALENAFWLLPLTLFIWVYAKEKTEDEYIKTLRLDAMQIAIYANYAILLLSNLLVYGVDFLIVQVINLVTIPLIFQIRFQYLLYRLRRQDARNGLNLSCL
jgi:hypothetical protein